MQHIGMILNSLSFKRSFDLYNWILQRMKDDLASPQAKGKDDGDVRQVLHYLSFFHHEINSN